MVVLVMVMRMGVGHFVVGVFVGVLAALVRLAGMAMIVMAIVVRVLVSVGNSVVAMTVRMLCHGDLHDVQIEIKPQRS